MTATGARAPSGGRAPGPIRRLRWTALSLALALALLEALGRLLPAPPIRSAWSIPILLTQRAYVERDPVLFWKLPHKAEPRFESAARHRVLCLADSVTVMDDGHGYPEMLEPLLATRLDGGVSVWNAGVPGYTTEQALRYLAAYGAAAAPTIVTVQLAWNDHSPAMGGKPDHEVRLPPRWVLRAQAVLDDSGLYQMLRRAVGKGRYVPGPGLRVPLDRYRANLEALVVRSRMRGARVVLLTSPYLSEHEPYTPIHHAYNAALLEIASATGATALDVTAPFVDHPELFLRPESDHVHFNAEGSRLIAERLAETLARVAAEPASAPRADASSPAS